MYDAGEPALLLNKKTSQQHQPSLKSPNTCIPVVVTGKTPVLIYTHGSVGSATGRNDFKSGDFPHSIVNGLPFYKRIPVKKMIPVSDGVLFNSFTTVVGGLGGAEGLSAIKQFAAGTGAPLTYEAGTNFSTLAQAASSVKTAVASIKGMLDKLFHAQALSCRVDYTKIKLPGVVPSISFGAADSVALKAVIGGTQALRVLLNSFSSHPGRKYTATLRLQISDHFGVSEDDLYASGLWEFYVLQHFRTTYKPFIHHIIVEEPITGTY